MGIQAADVIGAKLARLHGVGEAGREILLHAPVKLVS